MASFHDAVEIAMTCLGVLVGLIVLTVCVVGIVGVFLEARRESRGRRR